MTDDTTNNYNLGIYISCVKFIKPIKCVDANHETVIAFEFLDIVKFDVAQKIDKSIRKGCMPCSCSVKFEKGKSVMFKLSDKVFRKDTNAEIPMKMEIYQKLQCSCLPTKLVVGTTSADLRPMINLAYNGEESKPVKKTYEVKNEDGEITALLDMSLIMAKLDNVIINDFSVSDEGQFLMDNKNPLDTDRINIIDLDGNLSELTKIANQPIDCPDTKACPGTGAMKHADTCSCATGAPKPKDLLEGALDAEGAKTASNSSFLNSGGNQYEEISAVMNGNAVKIRIPRKKGSQMSVDKDGQKVETPPQEKKDKPERTMVFGENEVIMTMRQKGEEEESDGFNTQFTSGDPHSGKPSVNITPTNVPGTVQALKVIETDKDVFLLKINKKCNMNDKATLELELATPVPPQKPTKPYMEARSTQYDPNDCPPPTPPPEPEPEPEPEPPPPPPPPPPKKGKGGKGKGKDKKGGKGKGKGKGKKK